MGNSHSDKRNLLEWTNSKNRRRVSEQRNHQKVTGNDMSKSEQHPEIQIEPKENRTNIEGETSQQQSRNDQAIVEDKDSRKKQLLGDLTQSFNSHCKVLDCLNTTVDAQRCNIEDLHQHLSDNTVTDPGLTRRANGARLEDAIDVISQLQKSCESIVDPIKKSFLTLHADIDKILEFYGIGRIVIDKQKQSVSKIRNVVKADNCEVRKLEEDVKQLKALSAKKERENNVLRKQNEELTSELQRCRPRKAPATMQIFYLHEGKTILDIEKDFKSLLFSKLGNIDIKTCRSASQIDPNKMVIVLYIITSRVGADATNAIKDIPYLRNTILVLIHYQDVHSLSTERSADVLIDQQFKNLCGIIDLAFVTENGFYHCEMNESGIETLCTLCRQRPHEERM